jgi:hypothetical protein
MTETPACEMIELDFDDEPRLERLPFHGMFGAPTAWAARRFARESGWLDQFF